MNNYCKELSALAEEAFAEIRNIDDAVKDAKAARDNIIQEMEKHGKTPVLIGKLAEANAKISEASNKRTSFRNGKKLQYERRAKEIQEGYQKHLESTYTVDSSKVDTKTMSLLDSGILNVNDFEKLFNEAEASGNVTMMRIIGNKAYEAGKNMNNFDGVGTRLRTLKNRAKTYCYGNNREFVFSEAVHAFNRRLNDTYLINNGVWDDMVIPSLENIDNS